MQLQRQILTPEETGIGSKETEAANKEVEKRQTKNGEGKWYLTSQTINQILEICSFLVFRQKLKCSKKTSYMVCHAFMHAHHNTFLIILHIELNNITLSHSLSENLAEIPVA